MTARYDSSPSNLRALRDRLTAAAKREGVVFGRLQQHVGVLVVAQFMNLAADDQGLPVLPHQSVVKEAIWRTDSGAIGDSQRMLKARALRRQG